MLQKDQHGEDHRWQDTSKEDHRNLPHEEDVLPSQEETYKWSRKVHHHHPMWPPTPSPSPSKSHNHHQHPSTPILPRSPPLPLGIASRTLWPFLIAVSFRFGHCWHICGAECHVWADMEVRTTIGASGMFKNSMNMQINVVKNTHL